MKVKTNRQLKADLNLTNLVDVTFVLLIVFMITAPMMTQAIKVNSPKAKSENVEIEESINITLDKDRKIYLKTHRISKDSLMIILQKKLKPRILPILINADEELPYGYVIKLISGIKELGYNQIGFITKPQIKK